MNALQKFAKRIASRDVVTSGRIRAELKTLTALQRLSEMLTAATVARAKLSALIGDELKAATTKVDALDRDAVTFERLHAKEIARIHDLSAQLGPIQHAEQVHMIEDLRQQFIVEDAAVWAEVCRTYDGALIERAARAAAVDRLSKEAGVETHLAVGFPEVIAHPNACNVPSLNVQRAPRSLQSRIVSRTAELLAELRAEMNGE